jgi:hypothetical protein
MDHRDVFLGWSMVVVGIVAFFALLPVGSSAYAFTFAKKDFNYKFDKKRLPICLYLTVALAIVSFVYSYVLVRVFSQALAGCLAMTFLGTLGFLEGIGYVPEKGHLKRK